MNCRFTLVVVIICVRRGVLGVVSMLRVMRLIRMGRWLLWFRWYRCVLPVTVVCVVRRVLGRLMVRVLICLKVWRLSVRLTGLLVTVVMRLCLVLCV